MAERFDKLLADGRAMTPAMRTHALSVLARYEQFGALIAEVRRCWEDYARAISSQQLASHHGCLEHCAGSLHALETIEGMLRTAANTKPRQEQTE